MKEEDKIDPFKASLRKKLADKPVHNSEEDEEIWAGIKADIGFGEKKKSATVIPLYWYASAASVALLLVAGSLFYFFNQPQNVPLAKSNFPISADSTIQVAKNEKVISNSNQTATSDSKPNKVETETKWVSQRSKTLQHHDLPDGTFLAMNKGAEIRHAENFQDERTLSMSGEVYFEVVSDKTKPFTVEFGKHKLVVLGTKFSIRAIEGSSDAEVIVTEGLVQVFANNASKGIKVHPGQQLTIEGNKTNLHAENAKALLAWKKGLLNFENTTMADVADLLSRQFGVQVQCDATIANCSFTGNLSELELKEVFKIIELTTSFVAKEENHDFFISGQGCN
jgi:hypothetical protein